MKLLASYSIIGSEKLPLLRSSTPHHSTKLFIIDSTVLENNNSKVSVSVQRNSKEHTDFVKKKENRLKELKEDKVNGASSSYIIGIDFSYDFSDSSIITYSILLHGRL